MDAGREIRFCAECGTARESPAARYCTCCGRPFALEEHKPTGPPPGAAPNPPVSPSPSSTSPSSPDQVHNGRAASPATVSPASSARRTSHDGVPVGDKSWLSQHWFLFTIAIVGFVAVALVIVLVIAMSRGDSGEDFRPSAPPMSQVLLDYYSASGIRKSVLCNDLESGVGADDWATQAARQTGLTEYEVKAETYAWCGLVFYP